MVKQAIQYFKKNPRIMYLAVMVVSLAIGFVIISMGTQLRLDRTDQPVIKPGIRPTLVINSPREGIYATGSIDWSISVNDPDEDMTYWKFRYKEKGAPSTEYKELSSGNTQTDEKSGTVIIQKESTYIFVLEAADSAGISLETQEVTISSQAAEGIESAFGFEWFLVIPTIYLLNKRRKKHCHS